jgi:adhesin/invasin
VVTDASGRAQTFYTSGTKSGTVTFTVTAGTIHQGMAATVLAGPAAGMSLVSGNKQSASMSTTLPAALVVKVVDQFNNVVPGASVTFSDGGVGGSFSNATSVTDATGKATVTYTLPPTPQTVNITATVAGVTPVSFTETAH